MLRPSRVPQQLVSPADAAQRLAPVNAAQDAPLKPALHEQVPAPMLHAPFPEHSLGHACGAACGGAALLVPAPQPGIVGSAALGLGTPGTVGPGQTDT